ncbi:MAG: CoA transferase [Desulfobacterales bacterium]|nr:CoA transferase [Desulfobacterales bacterium]
MQALDGITVIDLSRLLPGPFCSMILADHGARVIAIEDKKFLADGLFISNINRNKESISLNLKTAEGKEIFFKLIEKADVILEGFRPDVVKKLGVDYDSIKQINPKIIYCSISGYGQNGPLKDSAGHDINYLSKSGILNLIGEKDKPPSIPGVQFADIAGGSMNAAIGILLALYNREKTGKGQYIDISMTDGMLSFQAIPLYMYLLTGSPQERSNSLLSHRYAFYNTYETADGKYISIGALEHRFWKNLCEHLKVPEYIKLQYDEEKKEEIINFFRTLFKKKNLAEWEKELSDKDVCFAAVKNFEEILNDPLFIERKMITSIKDKKGQNIPTIGIPIKLSETPGSIRTPPDTFGESTENILKELGYSENNIKNLYKNSVI